jgi:hypothetical protein
MRGSDRVGRKCCVGGTPEDGEALSELMARALSLDLTRVARVVEWSYERGQVQ